jgi:hypothetical protein
MNNNTKLKIRKEDFYILKAYFQAQILLETLDEVENEIEKIGIKEETIKYRDFLETEVNEIIKNTYNSNQNLFNEINFEMRNYSNALEKFFDII